MLVYDPRKCIFIHLLMIWYDILMAYFSEEYDAEFQFWQGCPFSWPYLSNYTEDKDGDGELEEEFDVELT